jgi:predicted SprT family Zn-dependent metalloprotease
MRPVYPTAHLKWEPCHLNKRKVRDVLLHEMIHQRVHQTGGWEGENSHNNTQFVNEVNRIAKLLGLDLKAKVIRRQTFHSQPTSSVNSGCLKTEELLNFPYSSRPRNYYYGI